MLDKTFCSTDFVKERWLRCLLQSLIGDFSTAFLLVCIPFGLLAVAALLVELVFVFFVGLFGGVILVFDLADGRVCNLLFVIETLAIGFQESMFLLVPSRVALMSSSSFWLSSYF